MCRSCWSGDHGAPVIAEEEVLLTAQLIKRLCVDLGQDTGGPLHWMLDDMNIDDGQFEMEGRTDGYPDNLYTHLWSDQFAAYAPAGTDTSTERRQAIEDICRLIWTSLSRMPEPWRAASIAYAEGWAQDLLGREPGWPSEQAMRVYCDELRASLPGPPGCSVPIPCPPFEEATLRVSATSAQDQAEQRFRALRHAMSDLAVRGDTFLAPQPGAMIGRAPEWQRRAWEHYRADGLLREGAHLMRQIGWRYQADPAPRVESGEQPQLPGAEGRYDPDLMPKLIDDLPAGMERRGFKIDPELMDRLRREHGGGV